MLVQFPTPNTDHLKQPQFESVYDPAEDTFILLDALEQDQLKLRGSTLCVEIGSGSGCVTAFLGSVIGPSSALYLTTDLSPHACLATSLTSQSNYIPIQPITDDLLSSLLPRLRNQVDVLLFNPPYVETVEEEVKRAQEGVGEYGGADRAWAGGDRGMKVTQKVLDIVKDLLSPRGLFYLVAIAQNKPLEIIESLKHEGLAGEIIIKRRAGGEHLHVIRFHRASLTIETPPPQH